MTGPKSDAFTLLPRIYRGEHLPHRSITELKARSLELAPERPWPVQADGEPLGWTPATFEIVRQPIRLKI
jgi:diacylglycerol kinase family enzyme